MRVYVYIYVNNKYNKIYFYFYYGLFDYYCLHVAPQSKQDINIVIGSSQERNWTS